MFGRVVSSFGHSTTKNLLSKKTTTEFRILNQSVSRSRLLNEPRGISSFVNDFLIHHLSVFAVVILPEQKSFFPGQSRLLFCMIYFICSNDVVHIKSYFIAYFKGHLKITPGAKIISVRILAIQGIEWPRLSKTSAQYVCTYT